MMERFLLMLLCVAVAAGGCALTGGNPDGMTLPAAEEAVLNDAAYIGEYLDADVHEPNLEIAKGENGKYIVQIGIYRLTAIDDGVGEMSEDGMRFTATDAAGQPIGGVIRSDGQTATVTFTDSTWEYLKNGDVFEYVKTSDTPNLWE